ncbi:hypothetical protein BH09PSE5_BH09PSE5_26160 [soil metagenome]
MRRLFKGLHRAAEVVCVSMFAAMFVLSLSATFMRYVLGKPLAWPDEVVMILLVWATFLTEALVLSEREQVTFDVVYDKCGPNGRRWIGIIGSALTAVMFAVALPVVFSYVLFLWRERTNVLGWRLDLVYACFLVYWVAVVIRAVYKFVALLQRDWPRLVADVSPDERANILG